MLEVYTKNNCIQCKMVKKWLDSKGVSYRTYNVDEEPEYIDFLKSQGFQGVPVVVSPEKMIKGFNPSELSKVI